MSKLVSIILPVYNAEKYINQCIDSVLNQTYKNLELVIVNDGSTDLTDQLIKAYEDERINYIKKDNSGVSDSRNIGISNSHGEYIMFIDADDTFEFNMVEVLYKTIEKNEIDLVRCNYNFIRGKKSSFINFLDYTDKILDKKTIKERIIPDILSHKIRGYVWLLLVRKSILEKVKFDCKLKILEDTKFYIEIMLLCNRIMFINDNLYNYNCNNLFSATKSVNSYKKNIYGMVDATNSILQLLKDNKCCKIEDERKFITKNIDSILNYFYLMKKSCQTSKVIIQNMKELRENNDFICLMNEYEKKYSNLFNVIIYTLYKNKYYYLINAINGFKTFILKFRGN